MRTRVAIVGLALLAAACGGPQREQQTEDLRTYDAEEAAPPPPGVAPASDSRTTAPGGPSISPTAARGVAFNYRYAFRLPSQKIAEVQEQHARACEELGVVRCRIAGWRYRVVNEHDIEAMTLFKLEPSIARRFGRAGVEAVIRAEGMLTVSEISGTDVGTSIRVAGRNIAELTEELNRIEARLRQRSLAEEERSRLEFEAQQLRQSIRAAQANREEQQESLATTPMVFQYGSGELVPGFAPRPSFGRALERAQNNFVDSVYVLFLIAITLLPWALVGLLGWWVVRTVRRRAAAGANLKAAEEPSTA